MQQRFLLQILLLAQLVCGNKMPTRCNRGFYCRSYCLHNMFRAPLCLSSGAQEYYTVVAACGISCCGFQVVGLVCSWGLCVRFAGCCSILQTGHTSAIKTSVASSWHFISTYFLFLFWSAKAKASFVAQSITGVKVCRRYHRGRWEG